MKAFAALYAELDASTSTAHKVEAMQRYFEHAPPADAAWAAYFLAGGKPRQALPTALLRRAACEIAAIDDWLFEACYQAVGDLAETIAHVLPSGDGDDHAGLAFWVEERLAPARGQPPPVQAAALREWWNVLDAPQRFLLVKLIGGGFRVGVSKLLVQRALAQSAGLDAKLVAQRMMGYTDAHTPPTPQRYAALLAPASQQAVEHSGQPYPFFLAHPLDAPIESLGDPAQWLVEWKYDGIRAQAVKRAGRVWLWSRGEELIGEAFPDALAPLAALPDGSVLDGELLVWPEGATQPAPFALLQKRLNRKVLGKKLLADAPVRFVAYDLLEDAGVDVRALPQHQRRARLEARVAGASVSLSPLVHAADWPAYAALRALSRERGVEGFMLKHRASAYGSGRSKADGAWWKWKIEPMTADAVLVYAQAGHGRRASVYTDYTFAVWSRTPAGADEARAVIDAIARREPPAEHGLQLVPFAKAYSGLTDEEFKRVDRTIRATTLEKFGPVRSVKPTLVFELGFEGIGASPRHKSGIAVRFPRMLRIRDDKPLHEADTLPRLMLLTARANDSAASIARSRTAAIVAMSSLDALTDSELVARCRAGQRAAWNTMVRRFQGLIFTVPRRAGLSQEQAADVFQVTFARLFEHLDRLDDPSRVQAWLVTTAKRESLRILQLSRRVVELSPAAEDDSRGADPMDRFASDAPLPDELLADLQQQDRLLRAVAQLDERSRRFVELVFLQDEPPPYAAIAAQLGMAEGSIGPTRARCLEKLRTLLRKV